MNGSSPDSWAHFNQIASASKPDEFIWRGQRDPHWHLDSSFERRLSHAQSLPAPARRLTPPLIRAWQQDYLDQFKMRYTRLRPTASEPQSLAEWYALGRHYGLTTRLLDWTTDPYIALAFAIYDCLVAQADSDPLTPPGPIAIYRLALSPDLVIDSTNDAALLADGLHILQVRSNLVPSIASQKALFTWLQSDEWFNVKDYLAATGRTDFLTEFSLRPDQFEPAFRELTRVGIDFAQLYPDEGGAARAANVTHMIESARSEATNRRFHLPSGVGFVP